MDRTGAELSAGGPRGADGPTAGGMVMVVTGAPESVGVGAGVGVPARVGVDGGGEALGPPGLTAALAAQAASASAHKITIDTKRDDGPDLGWITISSP